MYKYLIPVFLISALQGFAQTDFVKFYNSGAINMTSNTVLQLSDGSYLMAGSRDTLIDAIQGPSGFIKKIDAAGNSLWTNYYSIPNTYGLQFHKMIQTADDNYVVVGKIDYGFGIGPTFEDIFITKIDAIGNMLWYKSYGAEVSDFGVDVKELSDGNLMIQAWFATVDTDLNPYTAFHLIKTDAVGDSIWTRDYGHNDQVEQFATAFVETSDAGFALVGSVNDQNGGTKGYIIKTNSSGIEQWNKTINVTSGNYGELVSVFSHPDNFTVIGKIYGVAIENTIISNYSNSGVLNWTMTLNESDVQIASATSTHDGGYAIIGETTDLLNPHPVLLRLDNNGNKLWRKELVQLTNNYPNAIIQDFDSAFVITGNSVSYDPYTVFLARIADSATNTLAIQYVNNDGIAIYPNPTEQFLNIEMPEKYLPETYTVEILNAESKLIESIQKRDIRDHRIDMAHLAGGIYFICIYDKDNICLRVSRVAKL